MTILVVAIPFYMPNTLLAQETRTGDFCVEDLGGNSCTANDLEVTGATVISTSDPCTFVGDFGTFEIDFTIGSGNATERYDIGLYFAMDGGSAKSGDSCMHTTSSDGEDLDMDGGVSDECLDTSSAVGLTSRETVTILCTDTDGDSIVDPLSTCASWKQGNSSNLDCSDVSGAVPGSPSKCNCSEIDLGIFIDPNLAVEYASLDVVNDEANSLNLTWETISEENNSGFEIQIADLGSAFDVSGWLDGNGTTLESNNYSYRIDDLLPGQYRVRLKQIDFDGTSNFSEVLDVQVAIPNQYLLSDVYPNPFNPSAQVQFGVSESVDVILGVYDITGRLVQTLYDGRPEANSILQAKIDGSRLTSGIYLLRLSGPNFEATKRASLVK